MENKINIYQKMQAIKEKVNNESKFLSVKLLFCTIAELIPKSAKKQKKFIIICAIATIPNSAGDINLASIMEIIIEKNIPEYLPNAIQKTLEIISLLKLILYFL